MTTPRQLSNNAPSSCNYMDLSLVVTIFSFFFFLPNKCFGVVSAKFYNEVRTVANQIISVCPPSECIIFGVGRSPTPILAYFKSLEVPSGHSKFNGYSYDIPLTKFKYGTRSSLLSAEKEASLFEHFDKFIPSSEKLGDKRIMILDFGATGDSLVSSSHSIEKYLRIGRRENHVDSLMLNVPKTAGDINPSITHRIDLSWNDTELAKKFVASSFDVLGPHGSFDLGLRINNTGVNPKFSTLVTNFGAAKSEAEGLPPVEAIHYFPNSAGESSIGPDLKRAYDLIWKIEEPGHTAEALPFFLDKRTEIQKIIFGNPFFPYDPRMSADRAGLMGRSGKSLIEFVDPFLNTVNESAIIKNLCDAATRENLIKVDLSTSPRKDEIIHFMKTILNFPHRLRATRRAALTCLASLTGPEADQLRKMALSDPDPTIKIQALAQLGKVASTTDEIKVAIDLISGGSHSYDHSLAPTHPDCTDLHDRVP